MRALNRSRFCLALAGLNLLALLLTGTGCSTARLVYQEPSLTRAQLESGRVAFGAATALGGGEYAADQALAEAVIHQFKAARPGLEILPLEETRALLSTNAYAAILSHVTSANRWGEADLNAFRAITNRARYLLVLDVARADEQRFFRRAYYHDYDPSMMQSPYSYDVVTGGARRITVLYYLHDLQAGKTVWLVRGRASASSSRRQPGFEHLYHPAARGGLPSIAEVAEKINPKAAARLPR